MQKRVLLAVWVLLLSGPAGAAAAQAPVSDLTAECLGCHEMFHPGIVEGWRGSRHAAVTPGEAMAVEGLERKVSATDVPEALRGVSVGCAECHTLRPEAHADTFEHNGYDVYVVVSPDDCRTCHRVEREQYAENIMAHAYGNLADNAVFQDLQEKILGTPGFAGGAVAFEPSDAATRADACYYCHGTVVEVEGTETRSTDAGELDFPVLTGWPNQGVGRINPDGSAGACSACHTRHGFSIEMARKPYTCKQCHVGPDVPAYKVYAASKHGNIYSAMKEKWDFAPVPWTVGADFTAPTCAVCHVSLTVTPDGMVVNERTHKMTDRLGWRLFGLVYAHPEPKSPDTTVIRNGDGLPLPTDFQGMPAAEFLLDDEQIAAHRATMQNTCRACHDDGWIRGHFDRLDNTIARSNETVRTATEILQEAWRRGLAEGPGKGSPFDEAVERRWMDAWLLYANHVRFASAMAGGGDYGVFERGRYHLSGTVIELRDWLETRSLIRKSGP